MRGSIYSEQKCLICNSNFTYQERKGGLFCKKHPDQSATGRYIVKFGRQIRKRFSSFDQAERFLTGIRYEVDRGSFDARDYKADKPLSFGKLSDQWLLVKEKQVKASSYTNLKRYISSASDHWRDRNIKNIGYAELEDFLLSQSVSDKTRSNIRSCLHSFWTWLLKRRVITSQQFPEFPVIKYNLGYRKIISKDTQVAILDEVKRISFSINPRIWLGIKWLATYIAIRPGELILMKERDIDTRIGLFIVRHTKEGKEKLVPMLDEDKILIRSLPAGLPDLLFFRHLSGISGCRPGQPFGKRYLYKWWKKACLNLGIEDVDLYGGTRHSSATALKSVLSPEQIKAGTMHSTNKAFERYFQRNSADALQVFQLASQGTQVEHMQDGRKFINNLK